MKAPLVFILIVISTLAIFGLCWRRTVEGKDYTLAICFIGLLLAALSAYGLSWWILPTVPIEGAATPQQTYFRNMGAFLGLITFCLLIPYHFIVTMQRELSEGKHVAIKKLLNRDKESVLPRGTLYLGIRMLISMLALLATSAWWFLEISFRKLSPGAYRHLYVTLEMLIWFTYFALGVGWMIWYYRMINELKRECLIAQSFIE